MQVVCVYCPEIQVLQAVQDGELDEVENDAPETHAAHTASDVALHPLAILIPAAQEEQVAFVAGVVQKDPTGQGASATVPSGHQLPAAHWTLDDEVVQT